MWRPDPEIEKPPAGTDGPDNLFRPETVCQTVYRTDAKDASNGPLRLIHEGGLGEKLLQRACADVRQNPSRLPLWAFRLYQHQRLGRLGYSQVWDALYEAGRENGSDKWVTTSLLNAIAGANAATVPPPSMQTLLRGVE